VPPALLDQLLDSAGDLFDGRLRVGTVLIEEIDPPGLERALHGLSDVDGPTVRAQAIACVVVIECELGGNPHLVPQWGERLANKRFIGERSIRLGGVEERHTEIDGSANERDTPRPRPPARHSWRSGPCSQARVPRPPGRCYQVLAFSSVVSLYLFTDAASPWYSASVTCAPQWGAPSVIERCVIK
jgi:hypothetical protein